jgi:hypothetical protein
VVVMSEAKDVLPLETVGLVAKIEDGGFSIGLKSRLFSAFDRWLGLKFSKKSIQDEVSILENRAVAEARIAVISHAADLAKARLEENPTLVDRALQRLLFDEVRKQENREAVAELAVESLALSSDVVDDVADGAEVDDDWLNVFSRYSDDASSERARSLWGRVLAGEVRRPGQFSVSTLRFLSELDQKVAKLFESVSPNVIEYFLIKEGGYVGEDFVLYNTLQNAGLISGFEGDQHVTVNLEEGVVARLVAKTVVLKVYSTTTTSVKLKAMHLTEVGREIMTLLPLPKEEENFRKLAKIVEKNAHVSKIELFRAKDGAADELIEVLFDRGHDEQ